jgi:hypothetical protein
MGFGGIMRKLPIGIQDFEKLITNQYLYIDKTELTHKLITSGTTYFLSRPRRFGKSLLISTLKAIFEGKKHLFKGLFIEKSDWKWEKHPVFRLDLNAKEFSTKQQLLELIGQDITRFAKHYNLEIPTLDISGQFRFLIEEAHKKTGKKVAILVDEFDKPLLSTFQDKELNKQYRNILKGFYGVLKSADEDIQFTLLTGVTKFSQVSIFSDLNHLSDISMTEDYATLCGLTQNEIETNLAPEIETLAQKTNTTIAETLELIKKWYNGYRFELDCEGVYNPFSTLQALGKCKIDNYWFQSGTPTFLLDILEKFEKPVDEFENITVSGSAFREIDPDKIGALPILYQAGYLTLKEAGPFRDTYVLDYPNFEVRDSLLQHILCRFANLDFAEQSSSLTKMLVALYENDLDTMFKNLQVLFKKIPSQIHIPLEAYYHSLFYMVFELVAGKIEAETNYADGRSDAVVHTPDRIFVFEFKFNKTAKAGLNQIIERDYALALRDRGKPIVGIGVNFCEEAKGLNEWVSEEL